MKNLLIILGGMVCFLITSILFWSIKKRRNHNFTLVELAEI